MVGPNKNLIFFLRKLGFSKIKFKKSPGFLKIFIPYIFRRLKFLRKILGDDLYKKISYLRLPNIEVFAMKTKIDIDEEGVKKELLKLSLVGYEPEHDRLLNTWLNKSL